MIPILTAAALGLLASLGAAAMVYTRHERGRAQRRYREQLEEALADGILTAEELRELDAFRKKAELSEAEVRMVALAIYRRALREVAADARVTPEEEASLRRLQHQLRLAEADLQRDRLQLQRLRLLAAVERGRLPEVPPPFPIAAEEVCHWVVRATLCERLRIPGEEPPAGLVFPVAGEEPFQVEGARSALAASASILPLDPGTLVVTSRRTIFRGAKRSVNIPHLRLERLVLHGDGLQLDPGEGTPSRPFLVEDAELTGAILLRAARTRRTEVVGEHAARGA